MRTDFTVITYSLRRRGAVCLTGARTMRGPRLTEALLVEAADNYKVVFALAEFDPDFTSREIVLADKRDGKPLDAKEGPWRVIVPGDKRPARWIRQVTSFKIIAVK